MSADELPFSLPDLQRWLLAEGLVDGPVRLSRLGDGLSNLTYAVATGERSLVLRRPPPPPLPRGANDVLREARILRALQGSGVPVPEVLAVAGEGEVMDVPCYVMEHLEGVVVSRALPPALDTPEGRRGVGEALVDVLVALHAFDWEAAGLGDMGRPVGFLSRQLERLPRLLERDGGQLPEAFVELGDGLRATMPGSPGGALTHGDLRLGNVLVGAEPPPRLVGVLDWELAGIGDPLADLAYTVTTYAAPDEPLHAVSQLSTATREPGFPTRSELAERYAQATGLGVERLAWYEAFQLLKLAIFYEYNRRKADAGTGDPYYGDAALVPGLLAAARRARDADGQRST